METDKSKSYSKPEILVHIGLPKTGSSAIQKFCVEHSKWLATQGYYYPTHKVDKNGISGGHGKLVRALRDEKTAVAKSFIEKNLRAAKKNNLRLLVSSEGLAYEPSSTVSLLQDYNFQVIGFCRHPMDYFFSAYNQMVKRHYQTASIESHANVTAKNHRNDVMAELLTQWKDKANNRIKILPYSSKLNGKQSAFDSFFSFLNCELDYVHKHRETKTINASYCCAALELKRILNNVLTEEDDRLNTKIDAELQIVSDNQHFQKGNLVSRLSAQAYRDLGAKCDRAVRQIESLLDFSFFPVKPYKAADVPSRKILVELIMLVEHLERKLPSEMKLIKKRIKNNKWESVSKDQMRLCELFDCVLTPEQVSEDVFFSPKVIEKMPTYEDADFFREMAKLFWEKGDIDTAFVLISKAYERRRNGPVIKRLYLDIKQAYQSRHPN